MVDLGEVSIGSWAPAPGSPLAETVRARVGGGGGAPLGHHAPSRVPAVSLLAHRSGTKSQQYSSHTVDYLCTTLHLPSLTLPLPPSPSPLNTSLLPHALSTSFSRPPWLTAHTSVDA